jgi:hypothetical protein
MFNQESGNTTRRDAGLTAGLAGLFLAVSKVNAQTGTSAPSTSDLAILNYALSLEHLEATFYTEGLNRLAAADFSAAAFASVLGSGTVNGVFANLQRIRDHEVAHVETLRSTITRLGGTPVGACTYNFRYRNAQEFLQIAEALEDLGVEAYNGAIGRIQAAALKTAGATIATVEGRHAAYLKLVNSEIPFPRAFDGKKMMSEVLAAATAFITSCPDPAPASAAGTKAVLLPQGLTTIQSQISLDATQSTAANGQPLTYSVRAISGSASVTQANSSRPVVQFSGGFGDYVFELTVTDSTGATATDRITVRYAGV